ncbi:amino acid adenylation domain-containing protein [Catenibacillus scindens]|uniref:amino acid adenylation domain-containing protein n=1 Tax=Catenibacillus scindens TaxID=673271 RepID=UPI003207AEAE
MRALILTAGNGTRIRAISNCRSKCMLPVQGRPMLAWQLDRCAADENIKKVHIVVHRDEREIQTYFGEEHQGIPLVYHVQTDMENGLVGAIYAVDDPCFYEEPVLLILGDEYFEGLDMSALLQTFQKRPDSVLALTIPTEDTEEIRRNYTVAVGPDNRIIKAVEKPVEPLSNLIGTGIVIFPQGLLKQFAQAQFPLSGKNLQLVDLIQFAPQAYAYLATPRFCNLNTVQNYADVSRNQVPEPVYKSIATAFRAAAKAYSQRTAIVCGSRCLTYEQLDVQSDLCCENLLRLGCKPGSCVALMCSRTPEHMIAMLAVLKAGCYYLPLDEHLPQARLQYMVEKSQAVCAIVLPAISPGELHFHCPILSYADLLSGAFQKVPPFHYQAPAPDEPSHTYAYVIFTSGSTGMPKGAVITQRSVLNLAARIQEEAFDLLHKDRLEVGVTASFAFDLSVQQIYPSLFGGHTLHIIPYETKLRPASLVAALNRMDVCDGTPLLLQLIHQHLTAHPKERLKLKLYLSAGEELKKSIIHTFFALCPDCKVVNCYGPTECTVETTLFPLDRDSETRYPIIPIGKPIKNTRVYILNEERKLLCPGDTGDIWIAGVGVGAGYLYDEKLTAEVFCQDILDPASIMYRTGDRGYWGKDGNLYYSGRQDNQVKFKGYRIELGEIEKAVESLEGIELCKVILTEENPGTPQARQKLTAYYTQTGNQEITGNRLILHLMEKLPEYMIPQQYIPVENFKLNHNGKLDRNALSGIVPIGQQIVRAPQEKVAAQVNSCIQQICQHTIDEDSSLLSQGVDSLMLLSLLCELEELFSIELNLSRWTLQMTPREIAQMIKETQSRSGGKPEDHLESRRKKFPMLPMQKYLIELENCNRSRRLFPLFNQMIYLIPLSCELDIENLNRAFLEIQQEHDAFRLKFTQSGNRFRMEITPKEGMPVRLLDQPEAVDRLCRSCSGLLPALDEEAVGWLLPQLEEIRWDQEYPWRLLYCKGKEKSMLVLSVHHAVFDYYSLMCFMEELNRRYQTPLPVRSNSSFTNYAYQYSRYVQENEVREQAAFWDQALSDVACFNWNRLIDAMPVVPALAEEQGVDAPLCFTTKGNRQYSYRIPQNQYQQLKEFCQQYELGEFAVLFSLMLCLMYQDPIRLPVTLLFYSYGRSRLKPANTIGFFSFLLPFVTDLEGGIQRNFSQVVHGVEEKLALLKSREHGFWYMQDQKRKEEVISRSAIFDYQKLYSKNQTSIWEKMIPFECVGLHNPFSFRIFDYGTEAEISVFYNTALIQNDRIGKLVYAYLKQWEQILPKSAEGLNITF